jgi:hypothetical protein
VRWIALGIVVLGLGACGGRVDQGGDGGSGDNVTPPADGGSESGSSGSGSSGSGSSSGTVVPLCPTDPPTPGTSCNAPGQQGCIYVTVGSSCAAFICDDNGVWQSTTEGC